jgi:hypothetical protein
LRRYATNQPGLPDVLKTYWAWFDAMTEAEQLQHIGPVMNKLRAFTMRTATRLMLGQSTGVDLADVMRRRQLLVVSLAKGRVGTETALLTGRGRDDPSHSCGRRRGAEQRGELAAGSAGAVRNSHASPRGIDYQNGQTEHGSGVRLVVVRRPSSTCRVRTRLCAERRSGETCPSLSGATVNSPVPHCCPGTPQ